MATSFTYTPQTGAAPLTVNFSGTTDLISGIFNWDFGDSNTATGVAPSNIYTATGLYTATLTVSGYTESDIYLDSFITDDFASSGFDPAWDPAFQAISIGDCSGYYAYQGAEGDTDLIPSGGTATITGRFDFQWDWALGCTNGGNVSLHLYFKNAAGTNLHWLDWNGGLQYRWADAGLSGDAWSAGKRLRVRMTRGYTLDASGNPTKESIEVIRSYYYDDFDAQDDTWKEFSSSPESGVANSTSGYLVVNHATYNGYDNFILQADAGLPYTSGGADYATEISSGIIAVGSGISQFGYVAGLGTYDDTIFNTVDNIIATIAGVGYIDGTSQFVFQPTDNPPAPDSSGLPSTRVVLTNKNRYPYRIPRDTIVSKIDVYDKGKLAYRQGLQTDLWFNYEGVWYPYETGYTDRYGRVYITHSTDFMPNIRNCLGIAQVTIDGIVYNSNLMRYNFMPGSGEVVVILDAGSCSEVITDRSGFDVWDASGIREHTIDRMFGGC